ncbi:hypothetical protein MMC31_008216 [Peltigera leucophlebia]|nr:hypothetical protein [Peltigera leucophlebia]
MNADAKFDFMGPKTLPSMPNSEGPNGDPVTPTKFSEHSSFLKKSINDLSFTPEQVTRKNPRFLEGHDNGILAQILSKLGSLSDTVNSQTALILALEKRVEELASPSKGCTQANKANHLAVKKIETMADRVAAMAATSSVQSSPANNN